MWEYSQTTCEEKQICLQETGGREEALCWMWTKLSSALWHDSSDQQDLFSPSTVAAAAERCQRRWSLSSKKNLFIKTCWTNFCPSFQSVDSVRSGNVATLLKIGQIVRELWIVRSLDGLKTIQFNLSFQQATVQVLPNLSLLTSIMVNEWISASILLTNYVTLQLEIFTEILAALAFRPDKWLPNLEKTGHKGSKVTADE